MPDEYAIGFAAQMRNGNGGVAIGYGYDPLGRQDRNFCGGFLWSTGEQLRVSPDPGLAARLAQSGPTVVNGLQGNDIDLVAPANVPPMQTYFIDYDDQFQDPDARGHLGDIAIWRVCGRAGIGGRPFATWFGRPGFMTGGLVWDHGRRRIFPVAARATDQDADLSGRRQACRCACPR